MQLCLTLNLLMTDKNAFKEIILLHLKRVLLQTNHDVYSQNVNRNIAKIRIYKNEVVYNF